MTIGQILLDALYFMMKYLPMPFHKPTVWSVLHIVTKEYYSKFLLTEAPQFDPGIDRWRSAVDSSEENNKKRSKIIKITVLQIFACTSIHTISL